MIQKMILEDGGHLSYAEYGDKNGHPILIQHGLIASIDDSELFDRLIRSHARLVCIARPGYGSSSPCVLESFAGWADLISPLIQELELGRFDILAMSSGAPYAYSVASGFPDRVRNLYIFSGIPALYDEIVMSHWPYDIKKKGPWRIWRPWHTNCSSPI
jgi:pimeloyl-ACP methyl ester carboxylesterase